MRNVIQAAGCYDHSGPRGSYDGKWLTAYAAHTNGGGRRVIVVPTVALNVAEGLEAAHQQVAIHRDLKPAKILAAEPDWKAPPEIMPPRLRELLAELDRGKCA